MSLRCLSSSADDADVTEEPSALNLIDIMRATVETMFPPGSSGTRHANALAVAMSEAHTLDSAARERQQWLDKVDPDKKQNVLIVAAER